MAEDVIKKLQRIQKEADAKRSKRPGVVQVPPGPPAWAKRIIRDVCAAHGRTIPEVRWTTRKSGWNAGPNGTTSGACYYGSHIVIIAAGDLVGQKLVLLHELAHWIKGRSGAHSPAFYQKCWELYHKYHVPTKRAQGSEYPYKARNAKAGYRLWLASRREERANA